MFATITLAIKRHKIDNLKDISARILITQKLELILQLEHNSGEANFNFVRVKINEMRLNGLVRLLHVLIVLTSKKKSSFFTQKNLAIKISSSYYKMQRLK